MHLQSQTGQDKGKGKGKGKGEGKVGEMSEALARALLVKGFEDGGIVVSNLGNPIRRLLVRPEVYISVHVDVSLVVVQPNPLWAVLVFDPNPHL